MEIEGESENKRQKDERKDEEEPPKLVRSAIQISSNKSPFLRHL